MTFFFVKSYSIYSNEEKHSASFADPIDFICLDPRRLVNKSELNEFTFAIITGGKVLMNSKRWFGSSKSEEIQSITKDRLLSMVI